MQRMSCDSGAGRKFRTEPHIGRAAPPGPRLADRPPDQAGLEGPRLDDARLQPAQARRAEGAGGVYDQPAVARSRSRGLATARSTTAPMIAPRIQPPSTSEG